jgi:hypothetical protein
MNQPDALAESGAHPIMALPRRGVVVAVPGRKLRTEMVAALAGSGIVTHAACTGDQIVDHIRATLHQQAPLPEAFAIDVRLFDGASVDLFSALDAVGCTDAVLLVLSSPWPRRLVPAWVRAKPHVFEPFSMALFRAQIERLRARWRVSAEAASGSPPSLARAPRASGSSTD